MFGSKHGGLGTTSGKIGQGMIVLPTCFFQNGSLRGRRLKGKGKGVLGKRVLTARETRGGREEFELGCRIWEF